LQRASPASMKLSLINQSVPGLAGLFSDLF
jgi:hypothetical protein